MTSLLESNPFAARLETEDLVKKLEEEEKKLAALCPEEVLHLCSIFTRENILSYFCHDIEQLDDMFLISGEGSCGGLGRPGECCESWSS